MSLQAPARDALDTAKAMGGRVVRSQTLGDSIGYDLCIEPKLGEFNSILRLSRTSTTPSRLRTTAACA